MRLATACLFALLTSTTPAAAQGLLTPSPNTPPADDKTGTNPLNLQHQIDGSSTYVTLTSLHLTTTAYKHGVPLFNRRLRISGSVPLASTNLTGETTTGLGDVGADVEWLPRLGARSGLVVGVRTTWDTAGSDLGLATNTLLPYAQWVRHLSSRVTVAPFVGHRTSIGGDDFVPGYNDTLLGVYLVWRPSDRLWVSTQPQLILDHERDLTYGDVGGEVGYLLTRRLSVYGRPSFGYGLDQSKPYAWGIAGGVKFVM
ncbi:MAG TPA: hypothetical protein VMF13_04445 [Luteitalea sp.]|nr:hypothetical protein [Luteitalea sp.]